VGLRGGAHASEEQKCLGKEKKASTYQAPAWGWPMFCVSGAPPGGHVYPGQFPANFYYKGRA
jgi:hypothetical protein